MAKDFREYLVEVSRHEEFGRVFKEVLVGKVVISFQASITHSCHPAETLDDPFEYTSWEVALRQVKPAIDVARAGAWSILQHNYWAKAFDKPDFQRAYLGEFISVKDCQQVLEDVIEYSTIKGHLESEDAIRLVDDDEVLKKPTKAPAGCAGCGGGPKAAKK